MEEATLPKHIATDDENCGENESSRCVLTRVQSGENQRLVREEDDEKAQCDHDAESIIQVQGVEMKVDVGQDEEKRAPQHLVDTREQKRRDVRLSYGLSMSVHAAANDDELRCYPGNDTEQSAAMLAPEEEQV